MRLPTEFARLPWQFDVDQLRSEVLAFEAAEWMPHVQGFAGNTSIPLISLNGEMNDDFNGPMRTTDKLARCPYIQQVLASFDEVFGRSRLMGLAAGTQVPEHRDVNYHWYKRVRIHIPIITDPSVIFYCGDKHVHMGAGETWIFDSWKKHRVENRWNENRIHLVIDTAGSAKFWDTVGAAEWRCADTCQKPASVKDTFYPYQPDKDATILTEQYNAPLVMHPGEIDALITDIVMDMRGYRENNPAVAHQFERTLQNFRCEWRRLWSLYGQHRAGWPHYEKLIKTVQIPRQPLILASNLGSATHTFGARVLAAALNVSLADQYSLD